MALPWIKRIKFRNYLDLKKWYSSWFYSFFIIALLKTFYWQIRNGYAKESWQITEWLINYQGGFVRRGLLGEIIFHVCQYFNSSPYWLILTVCFLSFLLLVMFFLYFFIKKDYPVKLLFFVFFLGGPILNDFWVRKDVLLMLFFIAIVYLLTKKIKGYLLLVNLLLVIALFTHESIGFLCFPVIFLLLNREDYAKSTKGLIRSISFFFLKLAPSLSAFILCLYYKGNSFISSRIWDSWRSVKFPIQNDSIHTIPAAINGLSWSLSQALKLFTDTLLNFSGDVYAPIMWLLIIVSIYYSSVKIGISSNTKDEISNVMIFQFLAVLPLFILGWDYGRWIFFWVTSSFATLILVPDRRFFDSFPEAVKIFSRRLNIFLELIFSKIPKFYLFMPIFIGVPGYSWTLLSFYNTIPIVIVIQLISSLVREAFYYFGIINLMILGLLL